MDMFNPTEGQKRSLALAAHATKQGAIDLFSKEIETSKGGLFSSPKKEKVIQFPSADVFESFMISSFLFFMSLLGGEIPEPGQSDKAAKSLIESFFGEGRKQTPLEDMIVKDGAKQEAKPTVTAPPEIDLGIRETDGKVLTIAFANKLKQMQEALSLDDEKFLSVIGITKAKFEKMKKGAIAVSDDDIHSVSLKLRTYKQDMEAALGNLDA